MQKGVSIVLSTETIDDSIWVDSRSTSTLPRTEAAVWVRNLVLLVLVLYPHY